MSFNPYLNSNRDGREARARVNVEEKVSCGENKWGERSWKSSELKTSVIDK